MPQQDSALYIVCACAMANVTPNHFLHFSARQLIRVRTALNVGRRSQNETPMPDVIAAIQVANYNNSFSLHKQCILFI